MSAGTPPPLPVARLHVEPAPALKLGPIIIHQRLRTGLKDAPWSAMFMLSLVWFTWGFHIFAGGVGLTFTVKRYTENPQILSLVTTIATIIMLGPFVSYVSDKVWTRLGRRRPFLLLAWLAAASGMAGIAFVPEIKAGIDAMGSLVGLPHVSELVLLVTIVVAYTTFYDLQQPIEPLFLECVPPHQRGRFFAIRNMMFNLAALFFFQVLWPVFDERLDILGWLGAPRVVEITGQQCIYVIAAGAFLATSAYIFFCIEETKVPSAPNLRFRDLGVGRFVINFFKDVFFAKELYPFYLVLILGSFEQKVWGNFGAVMQETQFGFSKAVQAQWGLPTQLLAIFVLVPISGWYSDWQKRVPWSVRGGLLVLGAAAITLVVYLYRTHAPADIRTLPPFWVSFAINAGVAVCVASVFVTIVESLLDRVGRVHMRAWVSALAVVLSLGYVVSLYTTILLSKDMVIPVTLYMAMQQVTGTFAALTGTFVGPMIYEYIARSKMGTINSGRSVADSIFGFLIPNLGAMWVVFYSTHIHAPAAGKNDYTSLYILQIALFVPALVAKFYFLRMITTGRMPRTGVLEVEGGTAAERKASGGGAKADASTEDVSTLRPVA